MTKLNTPVSVETPQSGAEAAEASGVFDYKENLRQKIIHTLMIFPFVSRSMLHLGIGTAQMTALWKPILQEMVDSGEVIQTDVYAAGPNRGQAHTLYHLPSNVYEPAEGVKIASSSTVK